MIEIVFWTGLAIALLFRCGQAAFSRFDSPVGYSGC